MRRQNLKEVYYCCNCAKYSTFMRPHPPPSPLPGYPTPPKGPRPVNGNVASGSHTQLPRPAAPVPPNVPGLNRAKLDPRNVPLQAVGNNNPTFKDPVPPTQPGNVANRFDRSHFYKPATKLPEINNDGLVAIKPKPRKPLGIDGPSEPTETKELKLPAIPGAMEAAPPALQPIPRVRPISPMGHTFHPHYKPAPPANQKKQVHRVRPLHSQLQKVSSFMEAGPQRAPTPIESASYDPLTGHHGSSMTSVLNGVRMDLPSPITVPSVLSQTACVFQTAAQERIMLSPSCIEEQVPVASASKSNKALDINGTSKLQPHPPKPHPPRDKGGSHGGGGAARRRHYRS